MEGGSPLPNLHVPPSPPPPPPPSCARWRAVCYTLLSCYLFYRTCKQALLGYPEVRGWGREKGKSCHQSALGRLRVVAHFSSGIVGRAKRERAWKSPHARKGPWRLFSRGLFFTRALASLALLLLRKNGRLLIVYALGELARKLSILENSVQCRRCSCLSTYHYVEHLFSGLFCTHVSWMLDIQLLIQQIWFVLVKEYYNEELHTSDPRYSKEDSRAVLLQWHLIILQI